MRAGLRDISFFVRRFAALTRVPAVGNRGTFTRERLLSPACYHLRSFPL